jgi:hypothetical protein
VPNNFLVLPLLAGYCLVHFCYYFHFRSQRLDGYRLLIECALAGAGLLFLARCLTFWADKTLGTYMHPVWDGLFPHVDFAGTGLVTLALGVVAPCLVNLVFSRDKARERSIRKYGNNLLRTLYEAAVAERLISITLDNRKTYVGYVTDAPNLDPQDSFVRLIPLFSGYRDHETLELKFTTSYDRLYDLQVDPSDCLFRR